MYTDHEQVIAVLIFNIVVGLMATLLLLIFKGCPPFGNSRKERHRKIYRDWKKKNP